MYISLGSDANSKRWTAVFTCLVTRAVHIEVVEEMSASSFINALKRFTAIRGQAKEYRSDRGTNLVGAVDSLQINAINVKDSPVNDYLYSRGIVNVQTTPCVTYGWCLGAYDRGNRILDNMLRDHSAQGLTHEILTTVYLSCGGKLDY